MPFTPKKLALIISTLWLASPSGFASDRQGVPIDSASEETTQTTAEELLPLEIQGDYRTQDEKGHDNVYDKDISNLYVDRKYLERYRGVSTGDVFAGMNGVYNTDNRNGSALSPNIRGLSGNGRIPVTVDGTVQSIDVFMAKQGVNNRSYVDPNMFRSIAVEKGPSMTRGLKNGIGGSVEIRTIEADDIITGDKDWGLQIKGGTASNSISPSFDAHSINGMDYRDIPGARAATPWATPGIGFGEPLTEQRSSSDTDLFNGADRNFFMAGAWRNEYMDVLAAYSDARRGNWFAGENGVSDYVDNVLQKGSLSSIQTVQNLYPNIGKLYSGGSEVPYSSTQSESLLLKGNLRLGDEQKISLSYSRNKLEFGEMPAVLMNQYLYDAAEAESAYVVAQGRLEYPWPTTTVDQDIYKVGYEWKPLGSRWIDLEASAWRTESDSTRYQNGDFPYQITARDAAWDAWAQCTYQPYAGQVCGAQPNRQENIDGRYNLFMGSRQDTRSTRNGLDFSNAFQLADSLKLTAAADWQYEEQKDHMPIETTVTGVGDASLFIGPASGRRHEYGTSLNLNWQPVSRLNLDFGVRYGGFWSFDDETARRRAEQDSQWAMSTINVAQQISYRRLATDAERALYNAGTNTQAYRDYIAANNLTTSYNRSTGLLWFVTSASVPVQDGIPDSSQNPFTNGTIDVNETVTDPQGKTGTYAKYAYQGANAGGDFVTAAGNPWQRPDTQRAHAWSGQVVASYKLTDNSRTYVRYGSLARFPTLLETANRRTSLGGYFEYSSITPERNEAWEVGYTYDFARLLPALRLADVKLSYYHNTIHDFYDRSTNLTMIQMDRKIMSGYELQSRVDTRRYFANFGLSWRDEQKTCDKDFAVFLDPYYNRMPECMAGGMPGSLSFLSMQPKYSINLDLGTRLFNERLELGTRLRYHSSIENSELEDVLATGFTTFVATAQPYYWDAVKLIDLYAEFKPSEQSLVRLGVDNLTNRYYLDPLSKLPAPGPGRTIMLNAEYTF